MKKIFAFVLFLPMLAYAQKKPVEEMPGEPKFEASETGAVVTDGGCFADFHKYCPEAKGWKERKACADKNMDNFSPECKEHMKARKEEFVQAHEACKADMEKFCSSEKPGHGAKIHCLVEHKDEVSPACRMEMDKMKGQMKHQRKKHGR